MKMINDELIKKRQAYIEKYYEILKLQFQLKTLENELSILEKEWIEALNSFDDEVKDIQGG